MKPKTSTNTAQTGPSFLICAWPHLPLTTRLHIALLAWCALHPLRAPLLIRFAFLQAILSFIFLAFLPTHPISIPTAYGLSLAALILVHLFFYLANLRPALSKQ